MKQPKLVVVDFETRGIESRPSYPPVPTGVSIKWPGKRARYLAWGHLEGNNCSWGEAREELLKAWAHKDGMLFQNGKFDLDVAEVHMGLNLPPWDRVHDTLFLLFLDDPHQIELGLKPSSERLLGMPPEEQDAVADWLIMRQPVPGVKISRSKQSEHYFGRYVSLAPASLVEPYANGDTDRTEALFNLLWPRTRDREMLGAYDRERELMPILLGMERRGLPVDLPRLRTDVGVLSAWKREIEAWIIKRLKAPADLNLDSGEQLVEAMIKAEKVDPSLMPRTPTGRFQTNKEALLIGVIDKVLLGVLKYRVQLKTCLGTFMGSWLAMAEATGGFIHTSWNQTKSAESGGAVGTRTGRLSATWFMNIPKEFDPIFDHEESDPLKAKKLPRSPFKDLPPLPQVRGYITPFPGHVLIDRDYCFGPDTEVLTEDGFVLFEELEVGTRVAQWENGVVTYAEPSDYQAIHFKGDLIHIRGDRSTDLLVTPNHQCLLIKDHQTLFTRADEYPLGHYQQPHAGTHPGAFQLPTGLVRLLAAIQADATVKHGTTLAWKLKKDRKVARLHELLGSLNLTFRMTTPPSAPGYSITYVQVNDLPATVHELLGAGLKTFNPCLRDLCAPQRYELLRELAWWDGSQKGEGNWAYHTVSEENANLVQELASITGLRSVAKKRILPSGKVFTSVSMRTNYLTWTQTFTKTLMPYNGPVYCVTMPKGTVIVRRDGRVSVTGNSQQEPRILAHFDGGSLMETYNANPWVDFHDYAKDELAKMGKHYARKPVKNTNLGLIYGMGVGKLAMKNDMSVEEAGALKKAILTLYPGLKQMYSDMKLRAKAGEPIRTWGGREYYCEEPKMIDGRRREFDYKLVNVLIQGSAADCTKEAIIRFYRELCRLGLQDCWFLLLNVHDQLTASVPIPDLVRGMEMLRERMESVEFDVPILSEGDVSFTNWAELKNYDKKGNLLMTPTDLKALQHASH